MHNANCIPLYASYVSAGFPSPTNDYIEAVLDLNEHLVKRPNSTFYVRVIGDSMKEVGIYDGSLLVVDKSLKAVSGDIVLASINGEFTLKEVSFKNSEVTLIPRNKKFKPIQVNRHMDFSIWGVTLHAITSFR